LWGTLSRQILDYCTAIDDPAASETVAYIRKTLRDLGAKNLLPGQVPDDGAADSFEEKCKLGAVLRRIADKENTRDGMMQLYKMTRTNPTLNLDAYLEKSSPFFRKYVQKQMVEVRSSINQSINQSMTQLADMNGVYPTNHVDRPVIEPTSDRSSSSMSAVMASMPATSQHHQALAALDARAPHMPNYKGASYRKPATVTNMQSTRSARARWSTRGPR